MKIEITNQPEVTTALGVNQERIQEIISDLVRAIIEGNVKRKSDLAQKMQEELEDNEILFLATMQIDSIFESFMKPQMEGLKEMFSEME